MIVGANESESNRGAATHEIREYTSRGRLLKKLSMPEGSTATPFDPAALIEFLRERVPAFMLPRYITITDALPKTPTEKVKKNELKDWLIDERTWEHPSAQPSQRPTSAGTA